MDAARYRYKLETAQPVLEASAEEVFELSVSTGPIERTFAPGTTLRLEATRLPGHVVLILQLDLLDSMQDSSACMKVVGRFLEFCSQQGTMLRRGKHEFSASVASFNSDLWSHPSCRRARQQFEQTSPGSNLRPLGTKEPKD